MEAPKVFMYCTHCKSTEPCGHSVGFLRLVDKSDYDALEKEASDLAHAICVLHRVQDASPDSSELFEVALIDAQRFLAEHNTNKKGEGK